MDKQVELALVKWPNVPHCYGWLGLDARGAWRMRDQAAQAQGLLGSKISNPALREFIHRNYESDELGRYYFQNGPQRVYVELEATPYIAHFDPATGWRLQDGQPMPACQAVWLTAEGRVILQGETILAQIDDRDLPAALAAIHMAHRPLDEQQLLNWLDHPQPGLTFLFCGQAIPIAMNSLAGLAATWPFVASPSALQLA